VEMSTDTDLICKLAVTCEVHNLGLGAKGNLLHQSVQCGAATGAAASCATGAFMTNKCGSKGGCTYSKLGLNVHEKCVHMLYC
jgi:hypothetical protein